MVKKLRAFFKGTYLGLMLVFLYAPILVLMIFSFNSSKTMGNWTGFSFRWYEALFKAVSYTHLDVYKRQALYLISTIFYN